MAEPDDWLFTPRQQVLYERMLADLEELRRNKPGSFYVDDMFRTPELVRILGAGHPTEAYTALQEIFEARRFNNRDVQAAYTTLFWSQGANIDERLEEAGRELGLTGRNARPYSDRGLRIIAKWIVIDLTFANPLASPEYDVTVLPAEAGRITLEVQARGPANGQIGRPYWIEVNGKRANYPDAEILYEDADRVRLKWNISAKVPAPSKIAAGITALEIAICFRTFALPKISFMDEFGHPEYKVRFTSRRNLAFAQLVRRD